MHKQKNGKITWKIGGLPPHFLRTPRGVIFGLNSLILVILQLAFTQHFIRTVPCDKEGNYVLLSERINGQRATTSRTTVRERVPPHPKLGAKSGRLRTLRAGFSSFGWVERARA